MRSVPVEVAGFYGRKIWQLAMRRFEPGEERPSGARRGGRPRARNGARRDERLRLRVSAEERARIENLAQASALAIGTYLRLSALNRKIRAAVPAVNYDCVRELARLAGNLDQALVAIYTRGGSPELRPVLEELLSLLERVHASLVGSDASPAERP